MNKILSILTLTFLTTFAFGQTEKVTYKIVADSFEKNYNSDNFEDIFVTFSIEIQNALPVLLTRQRSF